MNAQPLPVQQSAQKQANKLIMPTSGPPTEVSQTF
jgi:hypothetical protein